MLIREAFIYYLTWILTCLLNCHSHWTVQNMFFFFLMFAIKISLVSITLKHEGGDGADKAEREAIHRSHSQLPYFLGRPSQENTVIKSGYCVKQGAVVSTCSCLGSVGCVEPFWEVSQYTFGASDDLSDKASGGGGLSQCKNTVFWKLLWRASQRHAALFMIKTVTINYFKKKCMFEGIWGIKNC